MHAPALLVPDNFPGASVAWCDTPLAFWPRGVIRWSPPRRSPADSHVRHVRFTSGARFNGRRATVADTAPILTGQAICYQICYLAAIPFTALHLHQIIDLRHVPALHRPVSTACFINAFG